ncbi:MAG: hypothetical protein WC563_15990 [Brevundimonas sp.]
MINQQDAKEEPINSGARDGEPEDVVESRVERIMELMAALKFKRGKTAKELAAEWGIPESRVRSLAAEASRRVARAVMDSDLVRAKVGTALERVLEAAVGDDDTNRFSDDERAAVQNRKVIVDAALAWSKIAGADAPKRQEVTGKDGGPLQVTRAPTIFLPPVKSDDEPAESDAAGDDTATG